jgi:hypothetical protein
VLLEPEQILETREYFDTDRSNPKGAHVFLRIARGNQPLQRFPEGTLAKIQPLGAPECRDHQLFGITRRLPASLFDACFARLLHQTPYQSFAVKGSWISYFEAIHESVADDRAQHGVHAHRVSPAGDDRKAFHDGGGFGICDVGQHTYIPALAGAFGTGREKYVLARLWLRVDIYT